MKKLWISILAVLITIGFAGCIDNGQNKDSGKDSAGQSSQIESDSSEDLDGDSSDTGSSSDEEDSSDAGSSSDEEDGSDTGSSSDEESNSNSVNSPSNGTVVPPITDGGNFDGTV